MHNNHDQDIIIKLNSGRKIGKEEACAHINCFALTTICLCLFQVRLSRPCAVFYCLFVCTCRLFRSLVCVA